MKSREEAEAIEQFGDDLLKLCKAFDRLHITVSMDDINAIENQEHLETIAQGFQALGARLSRECDAAEEADDRRRDNPLEPDFRRRGT